MSELLASVLSHGVEALTILLVSAGLGVIIDQLLYRVINSRAASHQWATVGRQLASGVRGLPTMVGVLLGVYFALRRLGLSAPSYALGSRVLEVVAIIAVTAFGARILGRLVRGYTEREGSRLPSTSIFVNLARGLVWVLGLISLLASLGVSIAPLITALGVGGLAVGLALQPTLENVFSGIQVLASRQIEPGDLIRLESGEEGTVLDVTWRNTAIRTPSNDVIIVPNAVIGRSRITNFSSLDGQHGLTVPVLVPASADLEVVERIATEVAREVAEQVDGVVPGHPVTVRYAGFGPNGITVNVVIRVTSYPARLPVRHEIVKRLQKRFIAEGIQAPEGGAPAAGTPAA